MKPGVTLLRAVALVCTGLALTACGGPMTEEEAAALEAEALSSQEAEVGSCGTWSAYEPTGGEVCRPRISCGSYCDEYGYCEANGGAYQELRSYRVCFDQYGNYTHTEYQYKSGTFLYCGC